MPRSSGETITSYGFALGSVAIAVILRFSLDPFLGPSFPYETLYLAILATAWRGGFRPALATLAIGAVVSNYFFVSPRWVFQIADSDQLVGLGLFLFIGMGIALLAGSMHSARREAESAAAALEHQRTLKDEAHEAVQTERNWFQRIVSTAPVVICSFRQRPDGTTCFPYASPAIEAIYGLRPEDLADDASPIFSLMHPEDAGRVRATIETSARELSPWRCEFRVLKPGGGELWVEGHSLPSAEADGGILWQGCLADITERKLSENALQERERLLGFVTSSARVGLVVVDGRYYYRFANESYAEIFGLDTGAIVGHRVPEMLPSAWMQIQPKLDRALSGERVSYELALSASPGAGQDERYFSVVYEPRTGDGGEPTVVVVVVDITERKQIDEALRASEARYRTLFEYAPDGIVIADTEGYYIECNASICRMFEYTRDAFIGLHASDIVVPAEFEQIEKALSVLNSRADHHREWQFRRKDGSTFSAEVIATTMPDGSILAMIRDITERKQMEESRDLFRALLDHSDDAIEVIDPEDGRFLDGNEKAWLCLGYSREEFLRLRVPDIDPILMNRSWEARMGVLRRAGFMTIETEHRRKDGSSFPVEVNAKHVRLNRDYVLAVVRDISERKRVEAEAREIEARFRQIAENIREVFWLNDPINDKVLYVSPAYETVWGRNCNSLYSSPGDWLEAIHPGDRARISQMFETDALGGTYDTEYRVVRPDGEIRWIHDRGFPVRNEAGAVYRIAGVAEDISVRRQAESASQSQQSRLEGIVNSAMDGIITIGEDHCVILMNAAAERMFGCRAVEVLGERVERFIPQRFQAAHAGHVREFGQTGIAARAMGRFGQISGLRSNGEEFPIEASISQIEVEGQKLFTVTCRDVTERVQAADARKKLEAQLEQSQKMEAFGQLAGGVAHDFNNLLTVITGYSELLQVSLPPDSEHLGMVEGISKAGERAAGLTRQLLAFSRRQVLEPRILDLNSTIHEIEKMLRRLIGEEIQLNTLLSRDIGSVKVDPGQIEQVIMNLAVNARDAMPMGGKLTIETQDVELDELYTKTHPEVGPGRYVLLAINDTGSGMPPEVRSRIFEPFFTTKGVGKGTGLGLAVVHGIVKQSGGSIEVYSEAGAGTTFKIYLPVVHAQPIELAESEVTALPHGTETVLLVEDEEAVREMAALALRSLGYNVLTAPGGDEALHIIDGREHTIDLLVTDVVMPDLSGRELAELLWTRHRELKVLFMSGYTDDAIMRHGVLQSDVSFLHKPFTLEALARKVREVLEQ